MGSAGMTLSVLALHERFCVIAGIPTKLWRTKVLCSGAASAYVEKVLKAQTQARTHTHTHDGTRWHGAARDVLWAMGGLAIGGWQEQESIWDRNYQLALWSILSYV